MKEAAPPQARPRLPRKLTPSVQSVQTREALRFCKLVFGDEPTEYRLIHPDKPWTRHTWRCVSGEHDLADLAKLNADRWGVYPVVNRVHPSVGARCEAGRGTRDADIVGIRAAYVDLDGAPPPAAWILEPSIIVESSPGRFHAYWLVADLPVHEFRRAQLELAKRHGGDESIVNPSRVMRLPGFLHTKGTPVLSRLLDAPGETYTRAELYEAFDIRDDEPPRRAKLEPRRPLPTRPNAYVLAALKGEHYAVARAPEGSRNVTLNKAAFNLGQFVGAGLLEKQDAIDVLLDACRINELPEPEATRTVLSGLRAGIANPRPLPEAPLEPHAR